MTTTDDRERALECVENLRHLAETDQAPGDFRRNLCRQAADTIERLAFAQQPAATDTSTVSAQPAPASVERLTEWPDKGTWKEKLEYYCQQAERGDRANVVVDTSFLRSALTALSSPAAAPAVETRCAHCGETEREPIKPLAEVKVPAALSTPTPAGGESVAQRQAREAMNPQSGSCAAQSGGQSYGITQASVADEGAVEDRG